MDRAINKSTGKLIESIEVHQNGSYQNLDKGEWIAPVDSISNMDELKVKEIPVHWVREKEYTKINGKEVWCSPCFAIYPGYGAKTVAESPTHKLLKNWLFSRIKNNDLEIRFARGVKPHKYENKIKLSKLDINWNDFEIEVTTKGTRKMRADILLPFNTKHILLGEGIVFEIQLSSQSKVKTSERTIGRALHGYSVCWLFEKDFKIKDDVMMLAEDVIDINSFSEQMHFAKKGFVGKLKNVVEEQCRFLDEKISETNVQLVDLENRKNEVLAEIENSAEEFYSDVFKKLKKREQLLIETIETMEDNPFMGLIDNYKQQLENKQNEIKERQLLFLEEMESKAKEKTKNIDETYPRVIDCPKCSGLMIYKITPNKGKELYECQRCNHIIWVR